MEFLFGLGVGYVLGILVAPAKGTELRRRIKAEADEYGREKARRIGERAGEIAYEEMKRQLS
jgi:gas vesicle protein